MALSDRIAASLKALSAMWFLSGCIFVLAVKGPQTIPAWIIWGSLVFVAGWIVVGFPLVLLDDGIFRFHFLLLAFLGGLAGGLLMLAPNLLIRVLQPEAHWAMFSVTELRSPTVAFFIAAGATALYRWLLNGVRR